MLKKLCCYGYDDLAVDICEKIYLPVKSSEELVRNVEQDFSEIIIMYTLEKIYSNIKNGNCINKESIVAYLKKYDRDITKNIDELVEILKKSGSKTIINEVLNSDRSEKDIIQGLALLFCKYMKDEKNISFNVSSDLLYSTIENTIENGCIKDTEYPLEEYFLLDEEKYDAYLAKRFGFFANNTVEAVKLSYGIHYVYDYLLFNGLISKETFNNCIKIIIEKRKLVLRRLGKDAWAYNFVCVWNKADSIEDIEYNAEKDYIQKVFYEDIEFTEYMPEGYMKTFEEIANRLREKERIKRESKTVRKDNIAGRNDPCPCGSGKKYKKCCGK